MVSGRISEDMSIPELAGKRIADDSSEPVAKRPCLIHPNGAQVIELETIRPIVCINRHTEEGEKQELTWAKTCSDAVWGKYRKLNPSAKDTDIVAGFIVRSAGSNQTARVVALDSGTTIVGGDKYSLNGNIVHDCHAEIIARRSLIRWLYSQLNKSDSKKSFITKNKITTSHTPFELRPFELWLYISLSPCGDATVFSRTVAMCIFGYFDPF